MLEISAVAPNPAFIIQHPTLENVFYATLERITENGAVVTFRVGAQGRVQVCRTRIPLPTRARKT